MRHGTLTRAECVVARSGLQGGAAAASATFSRRRVVAETDASDVAFTTGGRAGRPRRPEAPAPVGSRWTEKNHHEQFHLFVLFVGRRSLEKIWTQSGALGPTCFQL